MHLVCPRPKRRPIDSNGPYEGASLTRSRANRATPALQPPRNADPGSVVRCSPPAFDWLVIVQHTGRRRDQIIELAATERPQSRARRR